MVSIAVKTFDVCDFFRLAVTDWRLWFLLAHMTATRQNQGFNDSVNVTDVKAVDYPNHCKQIAG